MEFSKQDMKIQKGVAILFMLLLHLFCRKEIEGLYEVFFYINEVPLIYYFGLFGNACVPMFCFASGYGFYIIFSKGQESVLKKNIVRIFKLLLNYWIVLLLFVSVGYLMGMSNIYPGTISEFLQNLLLLSNSYNGAWWFVQTYVLLVIMAPWIVKFLQKRNSIVMLLLFGVIYLVSYIQRIKQVFDFSDIAILHTIVNAAVLLGTSLLPFVVGCLFAKEKIYSKIHSKVSKLKYKNTLCTAGILLLVVIHGLYESLIIAPATGIAFMCLFNLMDKNRYFQKVLDYLSNHSVNIWLTHMFFYSTIFPDLVFAARYPVFIFIWLVILCLITSHLINVIYKSLIQFFENKLSKVTSSQTIKIH